MRRLVYEMFARGVTTAMVGGRLLAGLLMCVALVGGCSSIIHGKPVASGGAGPTEPSFPKAKPSIPSRGASAARATERCHRRSAPSRCPPTRTVTSSSKPNPVRPAARSTPDAVGCEAQFANSPVQDGERANGVNITASGSVQWVLGNLGDIPTVTIDYRTYDAEGWTIAASESGTRFTNKGTGHGMFVSVENVETF